jgi:aminopeptidase N
VTLELSTPIPKGAQFTIRTVTVATPTSHILEGLYFDYTPKDAPRTIITQCQQFGFQRIVPSLDHMTAKSFYTVRIVADKRYTHLITNGDLAPGYVHPETGLPVYKPVAGDEKRVQVEYHNHITNMASYLFFLGAGTYETYRGEFEYCDGKTAIAELLVFPQLVEAVHAKTALKALIDSILWCYLSTGPEATEHNAEREAIYALLPVRDALKALKAAGTPSSEDETKLAGVRAELQKLISVFGKTGYAYTGQIYREISMQNSDYGGMEVSCSGTTQLARHRWIRRHSSLRT